MQEIDAFQLQNKVLHGKSNRESQKGLLFEQSNNKNIRGLERWFNTQELLPLWQRTQNLHERQKSLVTLVSGNPTPSSDLLRWSLYMSPIHIQANTRTLKSQNSKKNSNCNMPWHTSKSFTYSGSKMGRNQGEISSNKDQKC